MILQVRFRQFATKANRGVPPSLNKRLVKYQSEVKRLREQYREECKNIPTKAEIRLAKQAELKQERDARWKAFIDNIKGDLANPSSRLHHNKHSCRPIIERAPKTQEMRVESERGVTRALAGHQITQRRAIKVLAAQMKTVDFITRDNLEARITEAINHPVSYRKKSAAMVETEVAFRNAFKAVIVPVDPLISLFKYKQAPEKVAK